MPMGRKSKRNSPAALVARMKGECGSTVGGIAEIETNWFGTGFPLASRRVPVMAANGVKGDEVDPDTIEPESFKSIDAMMKGFFGA